jgi:hypothetical protein
MAAAFVGEPIHDSLSFIKAVVECVVCQIYKQKLGKNSIRQRRTRFTDLQLKLGYLPHMRMPPFFLRLSDEPFFRPTDAMSKFIPS